MFGRKKNVHLYDYKLTITDGAAAKYSPNDFGEFIQPGEYGVDIEVRNYVHALLKHIRDLEHQIKMKDVELEAIRPVVKSSDYKPAMSRDCHDCKYCITSSFDGRLLGCRKDSLCGDFVPREE